MSKKIKKSAKGNYPVKRSAPKTKVRRISAKAVKKVIRKGVVKHATVRNEAINPPDAVIIISTVPDVAAETTIPDVAVSVDEIVTPA